MRCREASAPLTASRNHLKHTHTHKEREREKCTHCYQLFCSPVRECEEAEKEGRDKERERGKVRWEGVFKRKRRQSKERKGERGDGRSRMGP